jgi:hypothetical protein
VRQQQQKTIEIGHCMGRRVGTKTKSLGWNLEREEEVKEKKFVAGSTSNGKKDSN